MALFNLIFFVLGAISVVFSVIAERNKNNAWFIGAIIPFVLFLILIIANFRYYIYQIKSQNWFLLIILLAFIGIPIYFLFQAKGKKKTISDENDYLDKIIDSDDEEIDY